MSPSKTRITLIAAVTATAALGGALVVGQPEPSGTASVPEGSG